MTLLADVVTGLWELSETRSRSAKVAILADLLGRLDANEVAVRSSTSVHGNAASRER